MAVLAVADRVMANFGL